MWNFEKMFEEMSETAERKFFPVWGAPEDTKLPVRATEASAGYDFFAPYDIRVGKGFTPIIWTNIKAKMPDNEYLEIKNRSSMMAKKDTMVFCSGIIDADYFSNPNNDGNIGIRFLNFGEPFVIKKGERICQGIFLKYYTTGDNVTTKRVGGHGSTNV